MNWHNQNTKAPSKGKIIKGDSLTQPGMAESIQSLILRMNQGETIPVNRQMFYPENEDDDLPHPSEDIHEKYTKLAEAKSITGQEWHVVEDSTEETSEVSSEKTETTEKID